MSHFFIPGGEETTIIHQEDTKLKRKLHCFIGKRRQAVWYHVKLLNKRLEDNRKRKQTHKQQENNNLELPGLSIPHDCVFSVPGKLKS